MNKSLTSPKLWLVLFGTFLAGALVLTWVGNHSANVAAPQAVKAPALIAYNEAPLRFEQNLGQTDSAVQYLSKGVGYNLFLTEDKAVLALQNRGAETKKQVVQLEWLNANPTPAIVAEDKIATISNYFIGKDPSKWQTNIPNYNKVLYRNVYPGIDLVFYGNSRQLEHDFIVAPAANPNIIQLKLSGMKQLKLDKTGNLIVDLGNNKTVLMNKPIAYQQIDGVKKIVDGHYVLKDQGRFGFVVGTYDKTKPLTIDPTLSYSTYLGGNNQDYGQSIAVDSSGNAYIIGNTQSTNFPLTSPFQSANAGLGDAFVTKLNSTGAVVYSTYLGGSFSDQANGIATDVSGNTYVTGSTFSTDFPIANAYQPTKPSSSSFSAFVTKLSPNGSALIYSTYLGGTAGGDDGTSIAVDSNGNAYVTGNTPSTDFPTTSGAYQTGNNGFVNAFITKLNQSGSALVYSTYLGGNTSDNASGIAIDNAGNAYVTGSTLSSSFPTVNPIQGSKAGSFDAFVSKLNPTGTALVYSTYLGGNSYDQGNGIAVDGGGSAYVTGFTQSSNFPTASPFQPAKNGSVDAFISKLNPAGSALVYSTYLGGTSSNQGISIAVDGVGNAYVTGLTSSFNFPTASATQPTINGGSDAFISELNPAGSLLTYSTYLGGSNGEIGNSIAVDNNGSIYVSGITNSTDFPTLNPAQGSFGGGATDAFVVKIAQVLPVTIDIKPGSFPNTINLGSNGVVPVAIFSTPTFDATTINPVTLTLSDVVVKMAGKSENFLCSNQDVNNDGLPDLVCNVLTSTFTLAPTDTMAVLKATTFGGQQVSGTDSIRVVSK